MNIFQVSWVRDIKILTVGPYSYTSDSRFLAFNDPVGSEVWKLKILQAKPKDSGFYECQINTEPLKTARIHLEVTGESSVASEEHETTLSGKMLAS